MGEKETKPEWVRFRYDDKWHLVSPSDPDQTQCGEEIFSGIDEKIRRTIPIDYGNICDKCLE